MHQTNTQAYVYIWRQISTQKWYLGSRTAKGCHPDDGYITSSKIVKPLIQSNPSDWERQLIYIGDRDTAYELEKQILDEFRAKYHQDCFNQHHNIGPFYHCKGIRSEEHKAKLRAARKLQVITEEHKAKLRAAHKDKPKPRKSSKQPKVKQPSKGRGTKGIPKTEEHKAKIRATHKNRVSISPLKGIPKSEEHKLKMREAKLVLGQLVLILEHIQEQCL